MKFPKIFKYDEEEPPTPKPLFKPYTEYKPKRDVDWTYVGLAIAAVISIVMAGMVGLFVHLPSGPAAPIYFHETGTVSAIFHNEETSHLVGKITESYNSTWFAVKYTWLYQGVNATLTEPTGQINAEDGTDALNHLSVGASVDLQIRISDGTIFTVDGASQY